MSVLAGKRVVVIGGSSGIGFAVAQRAVNEGAHVVVGSSNPERVAQACERLGEGAAGAVIDVRDEASVAGFFESAGTMDHLVFTAGDWEFSGSSGSVADMDLDAARNVFGVRFWGAMAVVKHALDHLATGGSITLTNGAIAHRPRRGAALSTAMAGSIEHLTRSLAVDLAPLRVNCVCPGYVVTEVWDNMSVEQRSKFLQQATEKQPLARAAEPLEVAEAYLYLMRGTFSTGQVLIVDGGMTLV